MAAYFHGNPPEISAGTDGGLQTLILMNPTTYVPYTQQDDDSNNSSNNNNNTNNNSFVFLDSHAPPRNANQQFVGIPLSGHEAASITAADNISVLHGYPPRVQYSLYGSHQVDPTHHQAACETPRAQRGLSLTLSSQQQKQQHRQTLHHVGFGSGPGEDIRVGSGSTASGVTNGIANLVSSKYLKAAQELLDEVVKADSNDINTKSQLFSSKKGTSVTDTKAVGESSTGAREGSDGGGEASGKRTVELGTAERQEIQMKKAKLSSMLHEVEQRYRQYHQQMQMVISSFEQAAGIGSAKSYTSLALKTISRQFRCLKEAIAGQIKAANKSLGEEDSVSGVGRFEGSRLKFVDNHLRQQRALQQLGMIQHPSNNAWRPQRGLPERAVSVLRAWLFEHFLHPYPKDSDKHMLAKQTGLTRSQVSNWFINARVRLWKPMVEEMYAEEMKEQGKNMGSMEKTPNLEENIDDSASKSTSNQEKIPMGGGGLDNYHLNPSHNGDLEGVTGMQESPKRLRTSGQLQQEAMYRRKSEDGRYFTPTYAQNPPPPPTTVSQTNQQPPVGYWQGNNNVPGNNIYTTTSQNLPEQQVYMIPAQSQAPGTLYHSVMRPPTQGNQGYFPPVQQRVQQHHPDPYMEQQNNQQGYNVVQPPQPTYSGGPMGLHETQPYSQMGNPVYYTVAGDGMMVPPQPHQPQYQGMGQPVSGMTGPDGKVVVNTAPKVSQSSDSV